MREGKLVLLQGQIKDIYNSNTYQNHIRKSIWRKTYLHIPLNQSSAGELKEWITDVIALLW